MFIGSKTQSIRQKTQHAHTQLENKQNYVPFISKSPRFTKDNKQNHTSLPKLTLHAKQMSASTLHALRKDKSQQKTQQQHFFKSRIQRFTEEKKYIPSPDKYAFCQEKHTKNHSPEKKQSPIIFRALPELKTIPTIPDSRNKFGYNFECDKLMFVQKSQNQLERERTLMKQYQQSLVKEKVCDYKKMEEDAQRSKKIQLEKKMGKIIEKQKMDNQEGKASNCKISNQLRPKYAHLYRWHPESQQIRVINPKVFPLAMQNVQQKGKLTKFQFFNSSEKRFKTQAQKSESENQKPSIRHYLQKMLTHQHKNE